MTRRFISVLLILFFFCLFTSFAESRQDEAHRYYVVGPVYEGFTWVIQADENVADPWEEGTIYIIDIYGNQLTDGTLKVSNRYFSEGLVTVWKDEKAGCIDTKGNEVIPFAFHDIDDFTEFGLACASIKEQESAERWGVIDRQGQWVIPAEWDGAKFLNPGDGCEPLVNVQREHQSGFMNLAGETMLPCEYTVSFFAQFHDKRLQVKREGEGYGYVNELGELVIPCQWTYAGDFSEGLARVLDEKKSGFIDTDGNLALSLPEGWYTRDAFHEGLALVENDQGLFGFIDHTGTLAIPCQWGKAESFSEGVARVWEDGKCGFIDTAGKIVTPCQWKNARAAQGGYIIIQDFSGRWGILDLAGTLTVPCVYTEINFIEQGVFCMADVIDGHTLYGLIRGDGTVLCPCRWSLVSFFSDDGLIEVTLEPDGMADSDVWNVQKTTCGFITLSGEIAVPCEYDIGYYSNGYFTLIRDGYLTILDREGNILF